MADSDFSDDEMEHTEGGGGTHGVPETKYIKLISKDDVEFVVEEECCKVSGVLKKFIESDFKEGKSKEIRLDTISSKILERVVEYFTYKAKFKKATGGSTPSFDVKPEEALEVMAAANYLDC